MIGQTVYPGHDWELGTTGACADAGNASRPPTVATTIERVRRGAQLKTGVSHLSELSIPLLPCHKGRYDVIMVPRYIRVIKQNFEHIIRAHVFWALSEVANSTVDNNTSWQMQAITGQRISVPPPA